MNAYSEDLCKGKSHLDWLGAKAVFQATHPSAEDAFAGLAHRPQQITSFELVWAQELEAFG
jgi:hypothetical protein